MKISVIGLGMIGGGILPYLLDNKNVQEIALFNRMEAKIDAYIMDLSAAFPQFAYKLKKGTKSDLENSTWIAFCAGRTVKPSEKRSELLAENKNCVDSFLKDVELRKDAIVVVSTNPVDEITTYVLKLTDLPSKRVIGFGGSLDEANLKIVLAKELGKKPEEIKCKWIGTHGEEGIPIYEYSIPVETVKAKMRENLDTILKISPPRFAPAKYLAQLLNCIINDNAIHVTVCTLDEKNQVYYTWPCLINGAGVDEKVKINLMLNQTTQLEEILKRRKSII